MKLIRRHRIAKALLSSQYALMLEYRAEIVLWALSGLLPLIMLGVWIDSAAGVDAGYSALSLSRYFIAAFVVRQFSVVWVIHVFEKDALEGRLSPFLLQPLHPFWRYFAAHLSEQATRLPIVAGLLLLLALLMPTAVQWPGLSAFLLGLLATQLAFLVRFLLQSVLTMLCFWSERATALDRLLQIPYIFLSGLVAPLDVFPPAVKSIALWTPFPYVLSFPAKLLAAETVNLSAGFGALLAWTLLLLTLTLALWRAGVRHYSAMGA